MTIERYWNEAWSGLGITAPLDALAQLIARYSEPHRHYHNVRHLEECFEKFELLRADCANVSGVMLALWYHDAIYDTQAKDNEAASAQLAADTLIKHGAAESSVRVIRELILATKHSDAEAHGDTALLLDIDLSILGADPARFDQYEHDIRAEYNWVPDDLYRAGRTQILNTFIQRPRIYNSAAFFSRYETQARQNLRTAIARLA